MEAGKVAWFMTRVELHDANYQDYTALHAHMAGEGYTTTIRGSDGRTYQLPPAEYHLDGAYTRAQALEKAKRAAQRTSKAFAVVVSETVAATWVGLPVVQPARPLSRVS
jgi:hypothetical protein